MRTVVPMTARPPHARPAVVARPRALAIVAGLLVLAGLAPVGTVGAVAPAGRPAAGDPAATLQPTVQYEEAVAHANDTTRFAPGARVTVPFTPRGARPVDRRWRPAAGTARRPALGHGDARDERGTRPQERSDVDPRPVIRRPGRGGRRAVPGPGRRDRRHARSGRRPGRSQARGLRLPALLGADRPVDPAGLGEAVDGRLLRGRSRRQR